MKTDRQKLHDKLWKLFSIYIRNRDKRKCITCGRQFWDEEKGEWSLNGLEAGHYKHGVLDFDEMNINCQCTKCNHFLSGNLSEYSLYLLQKYGKKKFEDLHNRAKQPKPLSLEEYQQKIDYYKNI